MRTMRLPSLVFVLMVFVAALPRARQVPTTDRTVISGHIFDSFGCPIPDAAVRLQEWLLAPPWYGRLLEQTRSDPQGYFTFAPALAGRYLVEYRYERQDMSGGSGAETVTLGSGGKSIAFQLRPPSPVDIVDLQIRVTDLDDVPVPAARITWRRRVGVGESWCPVGTLTADANGRAIEPEVPPGTYQITAEADGFAPQSIEERHGWLSVPHTIRLLTLEEAEKAKKPTRVLICCGPSPPASLSELVHAVDAIIVGRVIRAAPDLAYRQNDAAPGVRTRYDIQTLATIKDDARLTGSTSVSVLHAAGEVEWQDTILVGCERTVLKQNDTYVLFLRWDEGSRAFWPAYGNELLANVSTGAVMPMRRSKVAPFTGQREGMSAEKFIREIKAALK